MQMPSSPCKLETAAFSQFTAHLRVSFHSLKKKLLALAALLTQKRSKEKTDL